MQRSGIFVRKTSVGGLIETEFEGRSAIDLYDELMPELARRTDAASFLARPEITRGNGETTTSIAWHVSQAGLLRSWSDLDQTERVRVGAAIARTMDQLRAGYDDPRLGGWLQSCLHVPSLEDSVILIGDRPYLVNWGLLPEEIASDPVALSQHQARTLGVFGHPSAAPGAAAAATGVAAAATASQAAMAAAAPGPVPVAAAAPAPAPAVLAASPLRPVLIATAIAALLLLVLLLPGVLLHDARLRPSVEAAVRTEANQALRQRIQDLQRDLESRVCRVPSAEPGQTGRRSGRAPVPPADLAAPSPAPGAPPAPGGLLAYLDRGAALIVAGGEGGQGSMGTGFFVNEKQLVTNRHVVESGSQVYVVSKSLGRPAPARIIAASQGSEFGSADFAVLEIDAAGDRQILSLSTNVERLQNVIAIGYPGYVMETDQTFRKLVAGDSSAAPQAAVTQGSVVALQTGQDGMELVAHTATIGPGNSGGPLVDSCGSVLGVNTFMRVVQENMIRLNFSLRSDSLRKFLDQKGVAYTHNDAACTPTPALTRPQPAQPAPPTSAAPPAASPAPSGAAAR